MRQEKRHQFRHHDLAEIDSEGKREHQANLSIHNKLSYKIYSTGEAAFFAFKSCIGITCHKGSKICEVPCDDVFLLCTLFHYFTFKFHVFFLAF